MGMDKEWEELKEWFRAEAAGLLGNTAAIKCESKMSELERRSLPERVAEILENLDGDKFAEASTHQKYKRWSWELVVPEIAKALRTGDLSEIQKWVK